MRTRELQRLKNLLNQYFQETGNESAAEISQHIDNAGTGKRRAGRKRKYSPEFDSRILEMKSAGKSVRDIAKATGCSIGYVQQKTFGHSNLP